MCLSSTFELIRYFTHVLKLQLLAELRQISSSVSSCCSWTLFVAYGQRFLCVSSLCPHRLELTYSLLPIPQCISQAFPSYSHTAQGFRSAAPGDAWSNSDELDYWLRNGIDLLHPLKLAKLSPSSFHYSQLSMFTYYSYFPFWWLACRCRKMFVRLCLCYNFTTSFWFWDVTPKTRGKMRASGLVSYICLAWLNC